MTKEMAIKKEKKNEQWYQASVWVGLAVFSLFVLCCTTFQFVREQVIMRTGTCIEAEYFESKQAGGVYKLASYVDENGQVHNYQLNDFNPVIDGDTVKLYYTEYIENAVPQNTTFTWIGDYLLFGAMLVFNIWRIVKNYQKPYYLRHQIPGLEV